MRILASPLVTIPVAALFVLNLCLAIERSGASVPPVASAGAPAASRHAANFGEHAVSREARKLAGWIAGSRDNASAAFAIVDKKLSRLHVFDSEARLRATSVILLGSSPGDDTVSAAVADVRPHERTTPAGRFVAELAGNLREKEVFWVSRADGLSIHPVLTTNPAERELQRVATPRPGEKRKSYGCINVPAAFFGEVMRPSFAQGAVVYILPETKTLNQVFRIDDSFA